MRRPLTLDLEELRTFDSARVGDRAEQEANALYYDGFPRTLIGRVTGRTAAGRVRIEWGPAGVQPRLRRAPNGHAYARTACSRVRFYGRPAAAELR